MRKKTKTLLLVAALATGPLLAAEPDSSTAAVAKLNELFPDTVVAKGKGIEIKRSQVDDKMAGVKAQFAGRGQMLSQDDINRLAQQTLDGLIQVQVLTGKATAEDKAAANDAMMKQMDAYKASAGGEENLARQLRAMGTTAEELRSKLVEQFTAREVLERELKIMVTDDAVKKFYDDNPSKFERPERVRVSHILMSTKDLKDTNPDLMARKDLPEEEKKAKHKQIEELLKRAKAGEDFTKLAKDFSDDPGVKQNNGEYVFSREDSFVPEFKSAAFALGPNQISDVVTSVFGYHILKLSERIPAKKVELAEVAPNIKDYLRQEQMKPKQKEAREYIAKLRKDTQVEILDEKLKLKESPEEALPSGHPPVAAGKPEEGK
jgi:peptidyl-prolyl cis-trans isomerase C